MSIYYGDRAIPSPIAVPYERVRPLLSAVYAWMGLGLFVTAFVAFLTNTTPALMAIASSPIFVFGSLFLQLGLVMGLSWGINRLSPGAAAALFLVYAALNGLVFGLILMFFSLGSIFAAFGTTAILFGIMTVVGFTTKTDLTKFGSYLMFGVIGIIIASIINIFIGSSFLTWLISVIGVIVFLGLTAYDTQNLKRMAVDPELNADGTLVAKASIIGALSLYLNFINIFLFLLQIMGGNRE